MCVKQCMGVTQKGARCLIKVHQGEFCHYHIPQKNRGPTRPQSRPIYGNQNDNPPQPRVHNASKSLPATPKKAKLPTLPTHVRSKNYTTSSGVSGETPSSHGWFHFGGHLLSALKYNNLELPLSQSAHLSPKRRPVDYTSIPSSPRCRNSPKAELAIQPGYIYVYTLSSFLSKHSEGGWIQTRNLSRDKKHRDKWVDVDMRRLQKMLIKVGMTTKTPAVRILQWEAKCNHKLQCLYPGSHPNLGKLSLSKMFSGLSLADKSPGKKYPMYVENHHGFFVPRNILHCEQQIHQILKNKFGRGEIHCRGCHESSQEAEKQRSSIFDIFRHKDESAAKVDYNIHNEWFPVPRKNLSEVFSIINSVCMKYTP